MKQIAYDDNLYYVCCFVETIARKTKQHRLQILEQIGKEELNHVYQFADVFHCLPLDRAAQEMIEKVKMQASDFDNIAVAHYSVPNTTAIASVYLRVIEDVVDTSIGTAYDWLLQIFSFPIFPALEDYDNPTYFQSRGYVAQCFVKQEIL